jgi:hypothetical protein
MILERITFLIEQLYKHSAYHSNCIEAIGKSLNHIARCVGKPDGKVTFGGVVELDPADAREAFAGRGKHAECEAVRMGFEFSQNLFLSIDPDMNDEVKKAIGKAPIEHLQRAFENYSKLNDLVQVAEGQAESLIRYAETAKCQLQIDVSEIVRGETEAGKRRLAEEYAKAREERKQIEAALRRVEAIKKKYESLTAEASNIVKAAKPATRGIVSIKS